MSLLTDVLDLLAPPRCCACRRPGVGPACAACVADVADLVAGPCARCRGRWCAPSRGGRGGCWPAGGPVRRSFAAYAYRGVVRDLVAAGKLEGVRAAWPLLGGWLAELAPPLPVDLVTWTPTEPGRRRRRGFDHAAELAHVVAARRDLPVAAVLVAARGQPDRGRGRTADRPVFAPRRRVRANRVALVDDVVTTGATALAAAGALRRAGAAEVTVLTVGRAGRGRLDGR